MCGVCSAPSEVYATRLCFMRSSDQAWFQLRVFAFDIAGTSGIDLKLVFVSCSLFHSHASWVIYLRRAPTNILRPLGRWTVRLHDKSYSGNLRIGIIMQILTLAVLLVLAAPSFAYPSSALTPRSQTCSNAPSTIAGT